MNKIALHRRLMLPAFAWVVAGTALAQAPTQTFPVRPVRLLVGWAPGGGVDVTARTVVLPLSQRWGQQVIVDNRPGAAGNLAGELTAKATADGYTFLLGSIGELAVNVSLFRKMPYHPVKDLSPVAMGVRVPNILVIHPSVAASNVKELVEASKASGKGFAFASPGNGSVGHLTGELLKMATGAKLLHVPYKGAAPATADLLGGQVQLAFSSMPAVLPHVKAGRLRALAVTTAQRVAAVPEMPTIAESGVPGFDAVGWYAFVAPALVPEPVRAKLEADIAGVLQQPDIRDKLTVQGLEPWLMGGAALRKYMGSEIERWAKVVRESGSTVD